MTARLRACLGAAVGLALAVACADDATRLAGHRERAEAYFGEQKYAEAVIEWKNVLQIDPNDAAAHYGLARAYLALREPARAYWELQETVRLDPANLEARLRYGGFLLFGKSEDFERALAQADAVLAADPARTEAHLLRGRALEALKRPEEARASYEKALEVAPGESAPLALLANLHRLQGRRPEAESLFRRLTEVQPGFASWRALGAFLAEDPAREGEAEAAYRSASEAAAPTELALAAGTLSGFYFARGRLEEAERALREGLERSPDDLELLYALARFYDARGDRARADATVEQATRARPDDVKPQLILSAYRGRRGDLEGALAAAEAALGIDPQDLDARLRKAELLIDLGFRERAPARSAQGRAIVEAALGEQEGEPRALFVQAKLELAEGRFADAVGTLRRVLDARPEWAQAHFLLGSALFADGDRPGARAELVRALEIDPSLYDARRVLAQVQGALGEFDLAIEEARRVLAAAPDDAKMRIQLAQSLVRQGRFAEARAELEVIPVPARDSEAHYALGRVRLLLRDPDGARADLLQALELAPRHPEVLAALLELDRDQGRATESLARLRAAVEAEPGSARLLQLRGLAELTQGLEAEAEASLRRAIELDPNDLAGYERLAQLLARRGRSQEMLATYESALAARPDSAPLQLLVGVLHEGLGRRESARERYEQAVRLDPELAAAKNNLAYLLAEEGRDLDRALDLAQEAKSLLPDDPNAADTLGWVLYKKNIPSAAIGYLKEAEAGFAREDPSLGIVRHHLALAYEANGEPDRAREVIERALADLDSVRAAQEARTGRPAGEPAWAGDLRSLRDRLGPAS
jgi:tetratricopeptide (TPR) repeat protein